GFCRFLSSCWVPRRGERGLARSSTTETGLIIEAFLTEPSTLIVLFGGGFLVLSVCPGAEALPGAAEPWAKPAELRSGIASKLKAKADRIAVSILRTCGRRLTTGMRTSSVTVRPQRAEPDVVYKYGGANLVQAPHLFPFPCQI